MRDLRDLAIVTAVMALATWLLGWWTVPLLGAAAALWDRRRLRSIVKAMAGAVLAWGILLSIQGVLGAGVAALGRDLAVSLGAPSSAPLMLTLILPAVLAGSAAGVVVGLARIRRSLPAPPPTPPAHPPSP